MIGKVLSEGDKVDIIRSRKKYQYKSKILHIVDEETLKLSLPIEGSAIVPLEKGGRLFLTFFAKKGIYQCSGEVIDRYKEEKIYLMVVRLTSDLEKIQRRQFYRLFYAMEIEFREWKKQEEITSGRLEEETEEKWNKGTTVDISGGGCRFNSEFLYPTEAILELRFYIKMASGFYQQNWQGKVTVSYAVPNRPEVFETRVEFLDLERKKREQLVKFIFEEERRIRRKERGLDH